MQISWHYFFPVLTKAKFNVILYNLEMFRFLCLANCWRVSFRFGWFMWILTREWVSAASSDGPCKSFSFVRSINLWKYINCCIWRGLWFGYAYVWFIITKHKALAKVQPKCKLLIAFEHFNRNLSIKRFLHCTINQSINAIMAHNTRGWLVVLNVAAGRIARVNGLHQNCQILHKRIGDNSKKILSLFLILFLSKLFS